jgi:hypothetical protein
MSVYHVAAGAIALTSGLLLTSALIAAEGTHATPSAQMNRAIYDKIYVPRSMPRHTARKVALAEPASAHGNRAAYWKDR